MTIKINIIVSANLWTRVPLSVLQESAGQQMGRTKNHVRISTVSDLQGESCACMSHIIITGLIKTIHQIPILYIFLLFRFRLLE